MKNTSPKSSSLLKRLTFTVAGLVACIGILALAQTQHAHPLTSRSASMLLRPAAMLLPRTNDYWHTEGSRILDAHNHPVRISGVNWSGFETKEAIPGGLDAQDFRDILKTIKRNGFNTVRIPFSNEMVEAPTVPEHIRFRNAAGPINTGLRDLTSIEIMDQIVDYAGQIGLKVILDNHRSEAGSSAQESGLWYSSQYPESAWTDDWTSLAHRYEHNSTVIGVDLRNEPHNAEHDGACWNCGGTHDWHLAAQRAGNAVLAVNPHLLIFVEGVDSYEGDTSWWGSNLEGVRRSPVHLSVPGRLVYSVHEYGPVEYSQSWFNGSTSSATLISMWKRRWAYISEAGIAPVWIGEFGTPNTDADTHSSIPGSEGQWFYCLLEFLHSHPSLGWTYWGINGEDHYGLLDTNYSSRPSSRMNLEVLLSITHQSVEPQRGFKAASEPVTATQNRAVSATYEQSATRFVPAPVSTTHQQASSVHPGMEEAIADSVREAVHTASSRLESEEMAGKP